MTGEDLKKCLPAMLTEIREFDILPDAMAAALDVLQRKTEKLASSRLIGEAQGEEVDRIASSLGIACLPRREDTRFAVRSALLERRPYTLAETVRYLTGLLGEDGFLLERVLEDGDCRLNVRVALGARNQLDHVTRYLENTVPLNMKLVVELLYNRCGELKHLTYGALSAYTFDRLRSDRTIKETE